ncbi:MAG: S8 family serine peptidase [Burkholderiales bacterium]|nr:S8 family serine peptidase [Burkholderiales bacterium]
MGVTAGQAAPTASQSVSAKAAQASPNLWFVEFKSAAAVEGGRTDRIRAEKAAFRKAVAAARIQMTERYSFERLLNGVSVRATPAEKARIERLPGVKAVHQVSIIPAPRVERGQGDVGVQMNTALSMTGADYAQNVLGLTGQGIKVGIIDTGVDVDHPALNGGTAGFPNPRVVTGYDFVGDNYNADLGTEPVPDANPDDCGGHGTHVAGIVGANGEVLKGVAPNVTFGAYRVFGCSGTTDSDIMAAAMERALADGMQVVNQSIGSSFQWPDYPTAKAADNLVKAGVVMVASIGNSGTSGLYAAGAPGVGKKVIGVASFDNTAMSLSHFTAGAADVGYLAATGAPTPPTSGSFPLARTGTPTTTNDACNALTAGSLTGQVALIRRGTCSFYIKAKNAQDAGASGVILYNNTTGMINPTVAGDPPITIPVVSITAADGVTLDGQIQAGGASMTWQGGVISVPNPTGGLISSFSSWGLAADLSLKPNLGAPGGSIYSTYPLEKGGYTSLSGTSMSAPHTAGAAALMLQADPSLAPNAIKRRLQNTAVPKPFNGAPTSGFIDMVHRQGAGLINIPAAVQAPVVVLPSELALGETEGASTTRTLTLKNTSASALTYDLSHTAALATGPNTFSVSAVDAASTVDISPSTVTVPAKGTATVEVTVTAHADLLDRSIFGGYVVATPQGGGQVLRVPYAGFKGDYQSIPVLTSGGSGYPWLAQLVSGSYLNRNDTGATYTMAGGDIPYFLLHLDHQSRKILVKATDKATGKPAGTISIDQYVGRNSTSTGFFAFAWDGTTTKGLQPDGEYTVTIEVLKALGDPANPAHWETFTTNTVTLARLTRQ